MINGEPYFRFWRVFVVESWGETTVSINNGNFYGREDGPDLLLNAIGGFASDGFPSFNGWNATLDADGTAYVGAEWTYPICPRLFQMTATDSDCPKRFRIECSNDKREWFQFGDDYTLPETGTGGGGGTGDPCLLEMPTQSEVVAHGQDYILTPDACNNASVSGVNISNCDYKVFYCNVDSTVSSFINFTVEYAGGFSYQIYTGEWPDITIFNEGVLAAEDYTAGEPIALFEGDLGGGNGIYTIVIRLSTDVLSEIYCEVINNCDTGSCEVLTLENVIAHGIDHTLAIPACGEISQAATMIDCESVVFYAEHPGLLSGNVYLTMENPADFIVTFYLTLLDVWPNITLIISQTVPGELLEPGVPFLLINDEGSTGHGNMVIVMQHATSEQTDTEYTVTFTSYCP